MISPSKTAMILSVSILMIIGTHNPAQAQSCPCDTDVDGSGATNILDFGVVFDCGAKGECEGCDDCDVDCDGVVSYLDVGAVRCTLKQESDCCDRPSGACTGLIVPGEEVPPCVVTIETACEGDATYHGDGSFCRGDNPVEVPATSTWGLVAMMLILLSSATVILGRRLRPAA